VLGVTLAAKLAACESTIFWTGSGREVPWGRERPRAAETWIVRRPETSSSSASSWGSGVVGGGVGAALWRPLSLREGVSALVSAGDCEGCVSIVKGSEEENLLFLQDMTVMSAEGWGQDFG
jgi:hypothetical protein